MLASPISRSFLPLRPRAQPIAGPCGGGCGIRASPLPAASAQLPRRRPPWQSCASQPQQSETPTDDGFERDRWLQGRPVTEGLLFSILVLAGISGAWGIITGKLELLVLRLLKALNFTVESSVVEGLSAVAALVVSGVSLTVAFSTTVREVSGQLRRLSTRMESQETKQKVFETELKNAQTELKTELKADIKGMLASQEELQRTWQASQDLLRVDWQVAERQLQLQRQLELESINSRLNALFREAIGKRLEDRLVQLEKRVDGEAKGP